MKFLHRAAAGPTGRSVLVSGIFFVSMFSLINGNCLGTAKLVALTEGANILDVEFGYSLEKASEVLSSLGEAGRAFYLTRIVPLDMIFPLSYSLFFTFSMAYAVKRIGKNDLLPILALPFATAVFDWTENACVVAMLLQYPSLQPAIVNIGSCATIAKFVSFGACVAAFTLLTVWATIVKLHRT